MRTRREYWAGLLGCQWHTVSLIWCCLILNVVWHDMAPFWTHSPSGLCGPCTRNVLSASPFQSPPQTSLPFIWWSSEASPHHCPHLTFASWMSLCQRTEKSTLTCLIGKGICWQDIRKLLQQKGTPSKQALLYWGPEPFPGGRNSQAASGALLSEWFRPSHFWSYVFLCMRFRFPGERLWLVPVAESDNVWHCYISENIQLLWISAFSALKCG